MTFSCRVHEAVIVKPIIWYSRRENGSIIEELIDYNWIRGFSYFTKNVSSDIKEVYCAGSFWYAKTWRNTSMILQLKDGQAPMITNNITEYVFRPNLQHNLRCNSVGDPRPNLSWKFNGFDISANAIHTGSSIILDFPQIKEIHAGQYVCEAENEFGKTEKLFQVRVEDYKVLQIETGVNYGYVIGIPASIILIMIIGISIYIQHWKQEQIGLTKAEIDAFINGTLEENNIQRESTNNQYAHDFAHLVPYNRDYEIPSSRYQIDKATILGSGAYGQVFKGLMNGMTVAIKTVNRNAEKSYLKALLSELKIMIYLGRHENVIEFLGSNTSELNKGSIYIFVKYCPLGNLESYLKTNRHHYSHDEQNENSYRNSFGFKQLLSWAEEIASGMQYLGSKKVLHGDLATRNVLLEEGLQAKITDFGLSRQLYDYTNYVKKNQEPLPWRWLAIESLRDLTFSNKSDVWSYGITLWEIFSLGEVPYPGLSYTLNFVEELENGLRMRRPKYATEALYETIISECWHKNPDHRPTFETICERLKDLKNNLNSQDPSKGNTNVYINAI